jgi:hypothetical protein
VGPRFQRFKFGALAAWYFLTGVPFNLILGFLRFCNETTVLKSGRVGSGRVMEDRRVLARRVGTGQRVYTG